jgi:hypothetical protein
VREEHKPRTVENMVMRKIFGPNRDEVTGQKRRLHMRSFMISTLTRYYWDEQNHSSEMGQACSTYGKEEKCIQPEAKRPIGRSKRR